MSSLRLSLIFTLIAMTIGLAASCKTSTRKSSSGTTAAQPPVVTPPQGNCASLFAVDSGIINPRDLMTQAPKAGLVQLGADKSFSAVQITSALPKGATLGYYTICEAMNETSCDRGFLAFAPSDATKPTQRIAYNMMHKHHNSTTKTYNVRVASCVWRNDVLPGLLDAGLAPTTVIPLLDDHNKQIGTKELYCGDLVSAGQVRFANNDQSSFQYVARYYDFLQFRMFVRSQSVSFEAQSLINQITDPQVRQAAEAFSSKPDLLPLVAAQTDLTKLATALQDLKSKAKPSELGLTDGASSGCLQNPTNPAPTPAPAPAPAPAPVPGPSIGGNPPTTTTTSSTTTTTSTTSSVTTTDPQQLTDDLNAASCPPGTTYNADTLNCDNSGSTVNGNDGWKLIGGTNQTLPPVRPNEQLKKIGAGLGIGGGIAIMLGGAALGNKIGSDPHHYQKIGAGALILGGLATTVISALAYSASPGQAFYLTEGQDPAAARFNTLVSELFGEGQDSLAKMQVLAAPKYLGITK